MSVKNIFISWKYPMLLLCSIGMANLGAWIYLIALNARVLDMGGSPLAVAALYIIGPSATIFTNTWSGSLIDRLNKRKLMVNLDMYQAVLIMILPLISNIWIIYCIVLFINMARSMYEPTSTAYITKLIPSEKRKRFNSLTSFIHSGAFVVGPMIAGLLFLIGTPVLAIYINGAALFLSGLITLCMPNLEKETMMNAEHEKLSFKLLKNDWSTVFTFSKQNIYIMSIYFLFQFIMVLAAALDSLEMVFATEVLHLRKSEYSFLVSIAGAGFITGACINALVVDKIKTSLLIGSGSLLFASGYIIYAFSNSFTIAAIGFFVLSFALAFANTGFFTFYQNNIPVHMMGRVGSLYKFMKSILEIFIIIAFGVIAQLISLPSIVIIGALIMLIVSVTLCIFSLQPSKINLYEGKKVSSQEL